ncbi:MAG: glycosyltransferase family 2 protein [Proteobacteria bacterium]|nr:glycosyltransferase family 2 protein [Pseudomonadota bacterium]
MPVSQETPQKPRISAFVICFNEEQKISRCLESLHWCDELLVIDSGSTDRTVEIAQRCKARVIHNPWTGFLAQKQFGLSQCQGDWVLNIDADEEVSPELAAEIQQKIQVLDCAENGFELLRVVFYLNRWWRKGGWYPEFRLRLMRRNVASWGGEDPHEHAIVHGVVRRLRGELRHYTYDSISDHVRSLNNHSSVAAQSLYRRGNSASALAILSRPAARFFKFFLLKRGFREGFAGLFVALMEAFYVFLKYLKLWELRRSNRG